MNSEEAKQWLLENGWTYHPDFNGLDNLTRNPLELIVIREDEIWYWKDESKLTGVMFKPIPISEYDLKDFAI